MILVIDSQEFKMIDDGSIKSKRIYVTYLPLSTPATPATTPTPATTTTSTSVTTTSTPTTSPTSAPTSASTSAPTSASTSVTTSTSTSVTTTSAPTPATSASTPVTTSTSAPTTVTTSTDNSTTQAVVESSDNLTIESKNINLDIGTFERCYLKDEKGNTIVNFETCLQFNGEKEYFCGNPRFSRISFDFDEESKKLKLKSCNFIKYRLAIGDKIFHLVNGGCVGGDTSTLLNVINKSPVEMIDHCSNKDNDTLESKSNSKINIDEIELKDDCIILMPDGDIFEKITSRKLNRSYANYYKINKLFFKLIENKLYPSSFHVMHR